MNETKYSTGVALAVVAGALLGYGAGFLSARVYDPGRDAAIVEADRLRGRLDQFQRQAEAIVGQGEADLRAIQRKINAAPFPKN